MLGHRRLHVTVAAGSSVTANFARIEHTVTVGTTGAGAGAISSEPGGISCGGACSSRFLEGDVVTLTAVPATGSVFTGWSGPCTAGGLHLRGHRRHRGPG